MLQRMAQKFTGDVIEAQDLVQDTLVLALRYLDSYQENTNLRAWLLRVMRNRFISTTRRHRLERKTYDAQEIYCLGDHSISEMGRKNMDRGGGVEVDDGFCDVVSSALDDLQPVFREAVLLCDIEGLSYAEAAQKAACPVGTIMSWLHRGRRSLRRRLAPQREALAAA